MAHPVLDRPELLQVLFYPRREYGMGFDSPGVHSIALEVGFLHSPPPAADLGRFSDVFRTFDGRSCATLG
jgi:hypothetical protein